MGLPRRVKTWLLLDWDERLQAWEDVANEPRPAREETTAILQDLLERQLDRLSAAIEAADTKAALVIPGVGIVASMIVGHVSDAGRKSPELALLLVIALVASAISVGLSILCLAPWWKRSNGPKALPLILSSGEDGLAVRLGYVNQLGFAVYSGELVLGIKLRFLNWAVRAATLLLLSSVAFVGAGGLQ